MSLYDKCGARDGLLVEDAISRLAQHSRSARDYEGFAAALYASDQGADGSRFCGGRGDEAVLLLLERGVDDPGGGAGGGEDWRGTKIAAHDFDAPRLKCFG